jgi:hypothetical protein
MTQAITIEHNGYSATLEWRDQDGRCRPAWWLHIGETPFPVGDGDRDDVAAMVREKYIGDPPPSDHSKIWGGYTCSGCGAKGVQLWRDYQTFLDAQTLRCRACCEAHEGKSLRDGGDQIGWSVPAAPTPDGSTFWGYSSAPMAAVDWWRALPELR